MKDPQGALTQFGITQSKNRQGTVKWTINIILDPSNPQPRSAYLDEKSKLWIVEPQTKDDSHHFDSSLPSRTKQHESLNGPSEDAWIDTLVPSDHTTFFRSLNWSNTPLGPCSTWPHALRLYTHMLFSDSRPAAIYWSPERIAIYNGGAAPLLGSLHPLLMGEPFEKIMPGLWGIYGPLFQAIETNQKGFAENEMELPIERNGYLEETWWDGGLVSLKDDEGSHGGTYFSWTEVTRTVLQNRRTKLAKKLGITSSTNVTSTWQHIHEVLSENPRDIPMAIMYSTDDKDLDGGQLRLCHTIGINPTYTAAPSSLNLLSEEGDEPLAPLLRRALHSSADFLIIDLSKEEIDPRILENVNWQGFGDQSQHIVIIPLKAKNSVRGYIILGLNPRRHFDANHEQFVTELARQLRDLMARVTTEEDTQKREINLKHELNETEKRISRLAEVVPVGIYELAADGTLLWANSMFWEIMELPPDQRDPKTFDWKDYIHPEDHARALTEMGKSLVQAVEISDTLRLKKRYKPPQMGHDLYPTDEEFWLMYAASPHLKPDGTVHSLMGSLTDISHLKWAEQLHFRNAEVARRERQRQEEFIDITSHEMRNPLSAITQCADSVIMALQEAKSSKEDAQALLEIIKLSAESAESILFCAAHQRRIIDDVLTLGKLDSKLLTVSPKAFHPPDLINQALQMFGTECEVNDIEMQRTIDEPLALNNASTVYGDPSRLMQIMVNLLSNAIKFTRSRKTRQITIRFGTSLKPPSTDMFGSNFKWFATNTSRPDLTQESEYGRGDIVYLYYAVIDSGKGIPSEFVEQVFTKFNQAERRTHTDYGGSGLGLYISQELTEMQGGQIGIQSESGVGSTFAFFTKARIAHPESAQTIDSSSHMYSVAKTNHAIEPLEATDATNGLVPPSALPSAAYTILLVEDNLLNQKILVKQLRKAGCTVRICNNGGEAVDSILHMNNRPSEYGTPAPEDDIKHFDCILMDWEMPVCDGIKASKKIRIIESQGDKQKNIIIGVTANARAEQISKAKAAGMDDVMPKPFRVSELLAKIREYVLTPE